MAKHGQKSFSRTKRLKSAKKWIVTYRGHDLVRGYKIRFGVSDVCAVLELRMLGADIPDARLEQARRDEQSRTIDNARCKQRHAQRSRGESDETFAFIAGYTEGDAPYGITWAEMAAQGEQAEIAPIGRQRPSSDARRVNGIPVLDDDETLPF